MGSDNSADGCSEQKPSRLWKDAKAALRGTPCFVIWLLTLLLVLYAVVWMPAGKPRSAGSLRGRRSDNSEDSAPGGFEDAQVEAEVGGEPAAAVGIDPVGDTAPMEPRIEDASEVDIAATLDDANVPLVHHRPHQTHPSDVGTSTPMVAPLDVGVPETPAPLDGTGATKSGRVRGVAPAAKASYAAWSEKGQFKCFDGSQSFNSFDVVNDEYCDCSDGSDEPGTSACAGLFEVSQHATVSDSLVPGFFCGWDYETDSPKFHIKSVAVRLAAVNDGICDCCGGEDEYNGAITCLDACGDALAAEKEEISKGLAGSQAREAYVKEAVGLVAAGRYANHDGGGPGNVFYALASHGCLKKKDGDFSFDVCLFDHVTQRDERSGASFKLGSGGKWSTHLWEDGKTHRKDYSNLVMGDGEFCHASHAPRRAEILFECGVTSEITLVQEAQVCVYEVHVTTPAACHPLHDSGAGQDG